MTGERPATELAGDTVLRLKAVAVVEPGALADVLQLFDERNVVPQRVNTQRIHLHGMGHEVLHIEIELTVLDLTVDALRLIAAKIAQMPSTLSTVFSQDAPGTGQRIHTLVIPIAQSGGP